MAASAPKENTKNTAAEPDLEQGTYEIIRSRLNQHGKDLQHRLTQLNDERKNVFGSIETSLIGSERISTTNNCIPVDMVPIGNSFIFGYNVIIGLKTEVDIADVFSEYYRLAFLRKPEFMGWSGVEPQTSTQKTEFTNDELQLRIDAYTHLSNKVDAINSSISKERTDAFFQLVEYPVKGATLINQKFLFAQ